MLPTPFRPEGSPLPVAIPHAFERFYRESLRRISGSRVRSKAVHEAYNAWATERGERQLTFSALRALMETVGHRRIQSNGVSYLDVGLAADFPTVPDNLQVAAGGLVRAPADDATGAEGELVARVDVVLSALLDLRHALVAKRDRLDPAAAAGRLLGLFDR